MNSPGEQSADTAGRVGLCLATAAVCRVSSIVPIFFGRLAGIYNTDQFDAQQGVERVWRHLNGNPSTPSSLRHFAARMPQARAVAVESDRSGASAVVVAIDAIATLVEQSASGHEQILRSLPAALGVAVEFDILGVSPPQGCANWTSFELRGQADLIDALPLTSRELPRAKVSELRLSSGMESMKYREAMIKIG